VFADTVISDWSALLSDGKSDTLLNNKAEAVSFDTLKGKVVGLLFGAQWLDPCLAFESVLREVYGELAANEATKDKFEVVYVSWDHTAAHFDTHVAKMPWLAVPFNDKVVGNLNSFFHLRGIPTLILVDEDGTVITGNGCGVVDEERAAGFPWHKETGIVRELCMNLKHEWTATPSIVLLAENCTEEEQQKLRNVMTQVAESDAKNTAEHKEDDGSILYFVTTKQSQTCEAVRELVPQAPSTSVIALDFGVGHGLIYQMEADQEITVETVTKFVHGYKAGELQRVVVSEERPVNDADPDAPGLTVVVANSFTEIVMDEEKHVLILGWAPQLADLKKHIDTVAQVLQDTKQNDKVIVCAINAVANELDNEALQSPYLPILKLFSPGAKSEPVDFFEVSDSPSASGILRFLHAHTDAFDLEPALAQLQTNLGKQFDTHKDEFARVFNTIRETKSDVVSNEVYRDECLPVILELGLTNSQAENCLQVMSASNGEKAFTHNEWLEFWKSIVVLPGVEVNCATLVKSLQQEFTIPCLVAQKRCTFSMTGESLYKQDFFWCRTCTDEPSAGCCASCAAVCHDGHELVIPQPPHADDYSEASDAEHIDTRVPECYCDCGLGNLPVKCQAMPKKRKKKNKNKNKN
jgi:nucleoredoxin